MGEGVYNNSLLSVWYQCLVTMSHTILRNAYFFISLRLSTRTLGFVLQKNDYKSD